ncbi:hypothetical protein [Leifsonia shinshuensis]|uniref:hypothetical protein n=1 Tax=Leifsonia TaxID=110932 RepID=UPI002862ED1B|nr:hypothetical protein [Leifsonia shinshuensis]MDR6970314.1 hypothetical protein [Leifsonia shinshuensis]
MQWWNDFVDWLTSPAARPVIFYAVVLAVAVILSGLIAAWIARGAIKGLLSRTDRQQKASAIAALVDAATEASVWNSLTPAEQVLSDRAVGQADIMVRLLPIRNSGLAATWAGHQLAEMKRASATFGYQLDPAIAEFRDRLIEWQNNPRRARKIFQSDLERWRFENTDSERSLIAQQDAWVAQQHHEQYAAPAAATAGGDAAAPAPATTQTTEPERTGAAPFAGAAADANATADTSPTARLGQPV